MRRLLITVTALALATWPALMTPAQAGDDGIPVQMRIGGHLRQCGADGGYCIKMNTSRHHGGGAKAYCQDMVNDEFVPMAAAADSAFWWKCVNGKAVITGAKQLDKYGYLRPGR